MLGIVQAILTLAYPLLIFWALSRFEPRIVAGGVLAALALRAGAVALTPRPEPSTPVRRIPGSLALPFVLVAAVAGGTAIWNDPLGLLLAPVFVNGALLAAFALSLRGQPIVETLARLQVDRLAPAEVRYCRRVTEIWCAFFVVNGGIALALGLSKSLDAWAFYTGFLSYVLMGLLFAGEYVHRHARFRRYVGAWSDPLLARLFPPRPSPEIVGLDASGGERSRRIELEVPTGLVWWPGHFPGRPMLPGVVQIDWALREVERWRGRSAALVAIEGLKFKRQVSPGDALVLDLIARGPSAPDEARGAASPGDPVEEIEFRFRRGDEEISQGRARFGGPSVDVLDAESGESVSAGPAPAPGPSASARWPEPVRVLVHRDPMIWLRAVEGHDARSTVCLVSVDDCGPLRDADGGVAAQVAIEWMAQCVAAHAGLERRARGEAPSLGLLLGSRCVRFARPAYTAGERFRVVALRGWGGEQGAVSFDCRVEEIDSGRRVADARLSCFVPGDEDADGAANRAHGETSLEGLQSAGILRSGPRGERAT